MVIFSTQDVWSTAVESNIVTILQLDVCISVLQVILLIIVLGIVWLSVLLALLRKL